MQTDRPGAVAVDLNLLRSAGDCVNAVKFVAEDINQIGNAQTVLGIFRYNRLHLITTFSEIVSYKNYIVHLAECQRATYR